MQLNLHRLTSPLIVESNLGLNDNLNGVEKCVTFCSKVNKIQAEIVQSLAKWKRWAIMKYDVPLYEGIYTDMNAIRMDEHLDEIHSMYVDQWDWELHISKRDRNQQFLMNVVTKIYNVIRQIQKQVIRKYGSSNDVMLPSKIKFITAQELLDLYPKSNSKERENKIAKKYGAVFVMQIGQKLSDGKPHDSRSPDYDDWTLNGDIIVYNPKSKSALELSSMGIRVNGARLKQQLAISGCKEREKLLFHKLLLANKLPQTIGGGIGQSRLCYFFLQKDHIGEVQSSVWTKEVYAKCKKKKIELL